MVTNPFIRSCELQAQRPARSRWITISIFRLLPTTPQLRLYSRLIAGWVEPDINIQKFDSHQRAQHPGPFGWRGLWYLVHGGYWGTQKVCKICRRRGLFIYRNRFVQCFLCLYFLLFIIVGIFTYNETNLRLHCNIAAFSFSLTILTASLFSSQTLMSDSDV